MSEEIVSHDTGVFSLRVCRDGLLMLEMSELETLLPLIEVQDIGGYVAWWSGYLMWMNCLALLLDCCVIEEARLGYFNFSEVTRRDAFRIRFENGQFSACDVASESHVRYLQDSRHLSLVRQPIEFLTNLDGRIPLPRTAFDLLIAKFDYLSTRPELASSVSILAKSLSEYKRGNYDTSLVLAWFVVEGEINKRWRELLESKNCDYPDGQRRINSDRRKKFEGPDYPVSVVSNLLELEGVIPFKVLQEFDEIRGYRNAIVHRKPNFSCEAAHCRKTIEVAKRLVTERENFTFELNFSYSVGRS